MTVTEDVRLRGRTRWSLATRCPRMAGYAILGEEPRGEDDETLLRFERGKLDERWFIENILDPRFGHNNVIRQKAVLWPPDAPVGELHTDAFVTSEGMPFEVKSHADGDPADFDYLQLGGQIHFDPDATKDSGVLVVIDRDLHRDYIPVVLTEQLVEQVEDVAAQVATCARTGDLPARVCSKPSDGRSLMCPFVDVCFADYVADEPLRIDGDIAQLAISAMHAQAQKREHTKKADEADLVYRDAVATLAAAHDFEPGLQHVGPGVKAKRSHIDDTERFALGRARKAGVWTPDHDELFAPFLSWSGAHDRWFFERHEQAVSTTDFGETAPWTDEDLANGATF